MIIFCVLAAVSLFVIAHVSEGWLDGLLETKDQEPPVDKWRKFGKRVGKGD